MSNRLFLLGLGICLAVGLGSCQRTTNPEPGRIERTDTPIELGLAKISDNDPSSRTMGEVLTSTSQITGEEIALYGVCELFGSGDHVWTEADRLINTTTAKVEFDAAKNDYRFNYATDKAYYPVGGFLNVYALYPSQGSSYVALTDDKVNAPSATITLADRFHKQYDVLHGSTEKLTVAQAQQAKVTFGHALAQLRIKIYRDAAVTDHPTLTKVVVRGVSKATMASIERATFTNSTNSADSLDFIAFEGSMPLSAITKETAHALNADTALMLFPGVASISKITVTVDGNDFVSYVPKTWDLLQGKVNTLTLTLRKMELRTETPWETTPWGVGQGVNEGVENNGKMIRVSASMLEATGTTKVAYTGAAPAKADITFFGFTHKNIPIVSVAASTFTTDYFNSGSLNDNPIFLEGLTLYDAGGNVLFSGQLNNGALSSGSTLYIDEANAGLLKKNGASGPKADLMMTFGGFGEGTAAVPYEVSTVTHLRNIDKLRGGLNPSVANALNGTPSGGAKFVQTADIDLSGITFTGIAQSPFYGIYDGQKHKIKNANLTQQPYGGLFGQVTKATNINTSVTNVILVGGTVRTGAGASGTGGLVGALSGGAVLSYCSTSASVSGTTIRVGGLVGLIAGTSQVIQCANLGNITSNAGSLGGLIGASSSSSAFVLSDCYSTGNVVYTGTSLGAEVGGLFGYLAMGASTPTLSNCYNRGSVTTPNITGTTNGTGSLVGFASASASGGLSAGSKNSYWLSGSYNTAVGTNAANVLSLSVIKTETELKGLAPTLGSNFKADYTTVPINGGFPILTWQ